MINQYANVLFFRKVSCSKIAFFNIGEFYFVLFLFVPNNLIMKYKLFYLLVVAITLAFSSCNIGGSGGKTETPKKIEVTGSAELEFVPDEIYMTFTLKEYLDAARQKVKLETIKTSFLTLCKNAGIADSNISIVNYSGNERWDYYWYSRRKKEPDFMASASYAIKVSSPDKLDKIVSEMNENAIDNFYISKTSHSKIEQFRKDVKTKALIASRNKAEYLAKSVDEEIGEALLIQELDDSYTGNYSSNMYSNTISQSNEIYSTRGNVSSSPNFEKMKLRYEMRVEYRLK